MSDFKLKVGLLCGGPSQERGISLNSARSVIDHLAADDIHIVPIYFDLGRNAYELSPAQLYSNTPSDFDFKIQAIGNPLSETALVARLRDLDIVFPAIHGAFGEDGGVQAFLEANDIPFIGSGSEACHQAFDKHLAGQTLVANSYFRQPSLLVTEQTDNAGQGIAHFANVNGLKRLVVKPARAGSSVGVHVVSDAGEAEEAVRQIIDAGIDNRVVVEPFCTGQEFTVIVIQNEAGEPVALLPTEIGLEMPGQQIFDYRKKYLPTQQVTYFTPPRFSDQIVRQIQAQAEAIFDLFGMRDCARFDGWVLAGGTIWFSDLNLVSGMEQNSFLFLQGAQLGLSHAALLWLILRNGCARYGISLAPVPQQAGEMQRETVHVIFGGDSSERQVSLMSGTNIWLKLKRSSRYEPQPFLLAPNGEVWQLPYALTLRHTVEEVTDACHQVLEGEARLSQFRQAVLGKLSLPEQLPLETSFIPRQMSLGDFIDNAPLVFIAIHGSIGENGVLQGMLDEAGVAYSGSGAEASHLTMDKYATGDLIQRLGEVRIGSARKQLVNTHEVLAANSEVTSSAWQQFSQAAHNGSLIVKPRDDGCSSGVVRLFVEKDWANYLEMIAEGVPRVPAHTFTGQPEIIEMPASQPRQLMLEDFIETDEIRIADGKLLWERRTGWIEITVGVLGKKGEMRALTPSIAVASGNVLSLEEKFQGGTGVNITPPPAPFVSAEAVELARQHVERLAMALGMNGFGRIDAFMQVDSGDVIIIEANSIPGLTPSTVIFHQALAESPPIFPTQFLEQILDYRALPSG